MKQHIQAAINAFYTSIQSLYFHELKIGISATDKVYLEGWLGAALRNNLLYAAERVQVGGKISLREIMNILPITELSCFSPICDRLYPFDNLLVYTDKEWVFYGQGVEKIKSRYAKQIKEGLLYYGGGERSFLGAVVDIFSPGEIIQMKDEIITLINK